MISNQKISASPNSNDGNKPFCFLDQDLFRKGSVGRTLFKEYIVPFLSLDDLVEASRSCRSMNTICHALTVEEIAANLPSNGAPSIGDDRQRSELDNFVNCVVLQLYSSHQDHRRRLQHDTERDWARLYHPAMVEDIALAMATYCRRHNNLHFEPARVPNFDWGANLDEQTPVLISAWFVSKRRGQNGVVDVTATVRLLLRLQGNTRLALARPRGGAPQRWYTVVFGDPLPRHSRYLWIKVRLPDATDLLYVAFEGEEFKTLLRAGRSTMEGETADSLYGLPINLINN